MKKYLIILSIILIIVLGIDATKRFSHADPDTTQNHTLTIKQETVDNKQGEFEFAIVFEGKKSVFSYVEGDASNTAYPTDRIPELSRFTTTGYNEYPSYFVRMYINGVPSAIDFHTLNGSYYEYNNYWYLSGGDSCYSIWSSGIVDVNDCGYPMPKTGDKVDLYAYFYWNPETMEEDYGSLLDDSEPAYRFTIKNGEERVFDNIPIGYEYELQQFTSDGWELVSINGSEEPTNTSGTMNDDITYTFLNRKTVDEEPEEPIVEPEEPQEPEPTNPTPTEPIPSEPVNPVKEEKVVTPKTEDVVKRSNTPNTVDKIIIDVELLTISMLVMGIMIMLIKRTK